MRLLCNLKRIMKERHITVAQLAALAGGGHEAISNLRNNKFKRVSIEIISKICNALNITLDQLFDLEHEDIWTPIKRSGEVTIHYGSRSLPEPDLTSHDPNRIWLNRRP